MKKYESTCKLENLATFKLSYLPDIDLSVSTSVTDLLPEVLIF